MQENKKNYIPGLVASLDSQKRRNLYISCVAGIGLVILAYFINNGFVFDDYGIRVINLCMIYAILALSLNLVQGFTGLFSLGSAGFMAVGAYVTTLLSLPVEIKERVFYLAPIVPWLENVELPFLPALLIGASVSAFLAFLIGFPVLRLTGDYLGVATLGFSEIIRILLVNLQRFSNGATGIKNIPPVVNIWWSGGALAIVLILLIRLLKSSYGRVFQAIRDDEVAAQAMGVSLFKHKLLSFVTSAFITAIAGGLLSSVLGAITPALFRYVINYDILLIVVLGGTASLTGSVIGGFIFIIAKEALRFLDSGMKIGSIQLPAIPGMRMVVFSIMLMVIAVFFRKGLMGGREFSWNGLFKIIKNFPQKIIGLFQKKAKGCAEK